jgi:hypothetical protein
MNGKILYILFIGVFLAGSCGGPEKKNDPEEVREGKQPPTVEFEQVYYDFGDLKQGEKVSYIFEFTNTGGSPLMITDAAATCGCTVPRYDKEPIAPGGKGSIEVVFDSTGRRGKQYKTIIVSTNTPKGNVRLTIKANVIV